MSRPNDRAFRRPSVILVTRDAEFAAAIQERAASLADLHRIDASLEATEACLYAIRAFLASREAGDTDRPAPDSPAPDGPTANARSSDAVLVDARSGNVDAGIVLCRRIRGALPDIPFLMMADVKEPDQILSFFKSGGSDYLVAPFTGESRVDEALRRILSRENPRKAEMLVVTSGKGGQGITTIAVNLADQIHSLSGARVLLVDFKLRGGDVSVFLDVEDGYSLADLSKDLPRLDGDFLFSALHRHERGFRVLFAPGRIEEGARIQARDIQHILSALRECMDLIVVDLPLDFQEITTQVIDDADHILLVTQQTVPSVRNAGGILSLFREIGFDGEKARVVVNRFREKTDIPLRDMSAVLEREIFATVANDFHTVNAAIQKGRPLGAEHGEAAVTRDIARLARRLTGASQPVAPSRPLRFRDKWRAWLPKKA